MTKSPRITDGTRDADKAGQGVIRMNKRLSSLLGSAVIGLGLCVGQALAQDDNFVSEAEFQARAHNAEAMIERAKRITAYEKKIRKLQADVGQWQQRGPTVQVPELDAQAAGAALALLVGGAFVLSERRKQLTV